MDDEMSPLGGLHGQRPPAPQWFTDAIGQAPERETIRVEGADIEALAWGRRGDPGLLLLHGFAAHADWWSFIAPFLAADGRRVAALSWSGMGASDWRDSYNLPQHGREALAVAEALGLNAAGKPLVLGHSYGSFVALGMATMAGDRLSAVIAADGPLSGAVREPTNSTRTEHRVYPTLEAALARFRFAPPQHCENLFVVDHIARHSLKAVEGGWTWKFDPELRTKMQYGDRTKLLAAPLCPVALMIGSRSKLMTPERLEFMRSAAPTAPWIEIPDAGHHLMADQPLPLVAATRGLFAGWPR